MNKQTASVGSPPPPSPTSFPLPTHRVAPGAAAAPSGRPGDLLPALTKGALAWLPQDPGAAAHRDTIPTQIPASILTLPTQGLCPLATSPARVELGMGRCLLGSLYG